MVISLLLFLMCVFTAVIEEKYSGYIPSIFTFVTIMMLTIVSGFRYNMGGSDYYIYESFYNSVYDESIEKLPLLTLKQQHLIELGYAVFMYVCANLLNLSYNGFLVLQSFIIYSLMYIGLRRYIPNWGLFLIFFMYKMFFFYTFVALRQTLTIVGFYCLLPFFERREMIKYYLLLIFISIFHTAALVLFVIYPLFRLSISKKRVIILSLIFGVLTPLAPYTSDILYQIASFTGVTFLMSKVNYYSISTLTISPLYLIEYYLLLFIIVKCYEKLKLTFVHFEFFMKMFLMALPIITIFRSNDVLARVLPYFYPSYVILFCYVCSLIKKSDARIFSSAFVLFCLAGMIKKIIVDGELMQYQTWLFNPDIHFFRI